MLVLSKLQLYTHCRGGAYVRSVHFTHSKLCLIVPCHPVALNLCLHVHTWACARAVCVGMSVSAVQNHIFGSSPFHTVIEISAFALIIHPENTEGVNQCPVMKPAGSEGGSEGGVWCWSGVDTVSQSLKAPTRLQICGTVLLICLQTVEHMRKWQCIIMTTWPSLHQICINWFIRCPLKCSNSTKPDLNGKN